MNRVIHPMWLCLLLAIAMPVSAGAADRISLGAVEQQKLSIEVPNGWEQTESKQAMPGSVSVRLVRRAPPEVAINVTAFPVPESSPIDVTDKAAILTLVRDTSARFAAQSVEGTLEVVALEAGPLHGGHFTATDKAPGPGEFKYVSQGLAAHGNLMVSFTVLSHDEPAKAREVLIDVVKSLQVADAK